MIALLMKFFGSKIGGVVGALSITGLVILGTMFLYYKNKAARLETENVMLTQNLDVANIEILQAKKDNKAAIASLDAYIKANHDMEREHAAESEMLRKANDRKAIENQELKKKFIQAQMDLDALTDTLSNLKPGEDLNTLKLKIQEQRAILDQMQAIIQSNDCLKAKIPDEIFKVLCEGCQ